MCVCFKAEEKKTCIGIALSVTSRMMHRICNDAMMSELMMEWMPPNHMQTRQILDEAQLNRKLQYIIQLLSGKQSITISTYEPRILQYYLYCALA